MTEINLRLRMTGDLKAGTAQHGFDTGAVRDPPIGRIVGVSTLDEVHFGVAGTLENLGVPEVVILRNGVDGRASALHRLEDKHVLGDAIVDEIESEQRVAQVVE